MGEKKIRMNPGQTLKERLEYFRGVNFHELILTNAIEVLELIPSLRAGGFIDGLESVKDSIQLG